MKRYLLFFGSTYYPHGGWKDFKGSYDELVEAEKQVIKILKEENYLFDNGDCKVFNNMKWFHIYDLDKNTIVRNDFARLFKRLNIDVKIKHY